MRLVWLIVVLTAVCGVALVNVFNHAMSSVNCNSGDAAVCLESLFFLEG